MEGTRTRGSLARRNDGQRRWVFRRRCECLEVASRSTDEEEAHVGADVQGHVEKRSIGNVALRSERLQNRPRACAHSIDTTDTAANALNPDGRDVCRNSWQNP